MKYRLEKLKEEDVLRAIYQYVPQAHVMLLLAIYSFVKDGMTFDQCVSPLLPSHMILNMSDEAFLSVRG